MLTPDRIRALAAQLTDYTVACRRTVHAFAELGGVEFQTAAFIRAELTAGAIAPCEPWYASESFSRYCRAYPSVMAHLGIANPAYGSGAGHHNEQFDLDEGVLPLGVAATLAYTAAVLQDGTKQAAQK